MNAEQDCCCDLPLAWSFSTTSCDLSCLDGATADGVWVDWYGERHWAPADVVADLMRQFFQGSNNMEDWTDAILVAAGLPASRPVYYGCHRRIPALAIEVHPDHTFTGTLSFS